MNEEHLEHACTFCLHVHATLSPSSLVRERETKRERGREKGGGRERKKEGGRERERERERDVI